MFKAIDRRVLRLLSCQGRAVLVDGTFGTNKYKFLLTTGVVIAIITAQSMLLLHLYFLTQS